MGERFHVTMAQGAGDPPEGESVVCVVGVEANTVDHIDGTDYDTQRYDPAMLRSLCARCHAIRTARQGGHARAEALNTKVVVENSPRSRDWYRQT
ncbi:HNH endonuclease signature motif containing protein [Fodinicola feengrottensis]|uniref:HNH endonuclease signature motif containing protein n=1 Tax=Fodinicola feengrottensis TaxID=435914 RepID=UPI002441D1E0|nr:HNH endonuclease signature motif containing protein [Fodinicola feengrottensis]